ncbi:hypothetical protein E6O75_ATG11560 [Venturia nashicola]|uniref:Uncharacterized protein n=1 Tax=Venturia nashicola TaxID=86259 RepID=A0A4Z1NT40_9PEZI|nr:hypothetical protein E6O75_ATG11560 [Venturia nashicola]
MSFTFTDCHHLAALKEHLHPSHGHHNEFPALTTKPQQDVDAVNQRTKIHPITDKRAQPWRELVLANLHNHDVTTLPSLSASQEDVREFLFFTLGCDRYGSIAERKKSETIQFIQCFQHGGEGLRKFVTEQGWLENVPFTWTSVYNKTYNISNATRTDIAKHCYYAITPLIEAECRVMEFEEKKPKPKPKLMTRFVEKLRMALCFGKKAKRCETPPPEYVEKEKISFDDEF